MGKKTSKAKIAVVILTGLMFLTSLAEKLILEELNEFQQENSEVSDEKND